MATISRESGLTMAQCENCGRDDQAFLIIHCKHCLTNKAPSGKMLVYLFEDCIELYCANCGRPVDRYGEPRDFRFENVLNQPTERIDKGLIN